MSFSAKAMNSQPSILPSAPRVARYLSFAIRAEITPTLSRQCVEGLELDENIAIGLGEPLVSHWGGNIDGLRTFPALSGPGIEVPSTQSSLWCWLRGDDQGELVHRSIAIADSLEESFFLEQVVDGFKHGNAELGLDLTGYEDGTENPTGDDAVATAFVHDGGEGIAGSSFVAVQQWVHDLRHFASLPQAEQDHTIGRRKSDNEELDDAPPSAHTKRTAQESFDPEAFVLRRSMPFADPAGEGLMFVAFGHSLDAFEAQLRRMAGLDDGIADALFRFTRPVTGGYYWCPPVWDGRLDLRAV
jgi:putative iron-dependent peroxidase